MRRKIINPLITWKKRIRFSEPVVRLGKNIKHHQKIKEMKKHVYEMMDKDIILPNGKAMNENHRRIWAKTFINYGYYNEDAAIGIASHMTDCIKMEKSMSIPNNTGNDPIVIICVKNDLERIQMSYKHHKECGIKYFCYLDNMSDDGTFEWLKAQECDLFRVEDKYENVSRAAWICKLISNYGFNRWYLIIDSDELFVWPGMENETASMLVSRMQQRGIDALGSCMIDMYKDDIIDKDENIDNGSRDIKAEYSLFDTDSYFMDEENSSMYPHYHGGPRYRVFEKGKDVVKATLTKYPLVNMREGFLYRYHYIFPYRFNRKSACYSALLHYKFIDGDIKKYKEIVKNGTYAKGSYHYKVYMDKIEKERNLSFMYEGTAKYEKSSDLLKINIIEELR